MSDADGLPLQPEGGQDSGPDSEGAATAESEEQETALEAA